MTVEIIWDIVFRNSEGEIKLGIIEECDIEKSTKNLANRATITLPEASFNEVLRIQENVNRGDEVEIKLGYKDLIFETEFHGYVKEIVTNDNALRIECEDELFLFRNSVGNRQFLNTSINEIARYLISEINPQVELDSDYDIAYEKFTIYQATAYDVLAKIQEETGADIYFENNVLHIHPAYTRKAGEVDYSPQVNIENMSLEYRRAEDKRVEVTIDSVGLDGKIRSYTTGQPGGERITRKVGNMSEAAIRIIADNEYRNRMTDGYEGSFDAWLFPFVAPSFTVGIYDDDYPEKDGRYYVDSVRTNMSTGGIVRTVQVGIKLSD